MQRKTDIKIILFWIGMVILLIGIIAGIVALISHRNVRLKEKALETMAAEGLRLAPVDYTTENQYYLRTDGQAMIAEGDDAYYFCNGIFSGFIYYMDKTTLEYAPLCSKPNCLHDQEPDFIKQEECDAYVPSPRSLMWYDGALYIMHKNVSEYEIDVPYVIDKYSPTGTYLGRAADLPNWVQCCAQHRGVFYYGCYDGVGTAKLYSYDLKTGKTEEMREFPQEGARIYQIFAYEDYLYIRCAYTDSDGSYPIDTENLFIIDINTGEETKLELTEGAIGVNGDVFVYQEQLLFAETRYTDEGDFDIDFITDLYLADLDGQNAHKMGKMRSRSTIQGCYDDIIIVYPVFVSSEGYDIYKDFEYQGHINLMNISGEDTSYAGFQRVSVLRNVVVMQDMTRVSWAGISKKNMEEGKFTAFMLTGYNGM